MARVVLFGAGASYGCGTVSPGNPPLGSQLFPVLRRLYPHWGAMPAETAHLFEQDFEAGMAEVVGKYGMAVAPLMQEMAIFFSIFAIPEGVQNLYVSLIRRTANHTIVWSTLNYECLLEHGSNWAGKSVGYFIEPGSDEKSLPIWKLHGSCNFKVAGLNGTRGVSFGTGVVFGGSIEPIDPGAVRAHYSGNTALYPAMALYAAGKTMSMSPAPIQEAQRRWARHVSSADKILLIGVRPNPADSHIWDPLSQTAAQVGFVGAQKPFSAWVASARPDRPSSYLGSSWSTAAGAVERFIDST